METELADTGEKYQELGDLSLDFYTLFQKNHCAVDYKQRRLPHIAHMRTSIVLTTQLPSNLEPPKFYRITLANIDALIRLSGVERNNKTSCGPDST